VKDAFYIVGPTAVGKSEIAAEVARLCSGEVVSADAFQIYVGLDLLTAKPDPATLGAVPHHLIGTVPASEKMNAEKFRVLAIGAIRGIRARAHRAFVVGGNGMYIKALTHGLSPLPPASSEIREQLKLLMATS
jgi:tRNA dimethylallyltransferase